MPAYTEKSLNCKELLSVYNNEMALLHVVGDMYERGVKVDVGYVMEALKFEEEELQKAKANFKKITGHEYQDSGKLFAIIFDLNNERYGMTEKGRPSFAADVLEKLNTPTANLINKVRGHEKRIGTYWSSFLYHADDKGILRASAGQSNTVTGRFSYRDPNLQNLPKEDEGKYKIRRSFVPRDGHAFISIDYQAMEYRLMLDYADEKSLIELVNQGMDVHEATAQMLGTSRKTAKTINFALLYGAGTVNLAQMLGVSEPEARSLKNLYFARLPKVQKFIKEVMQVGSSSGYVQNWLGRRFFLNNFDFAYKLPNYLIQGSGADVCKMAMVRTQGLAPIVLQIHDEVCYELEPSDFNIIDDITAVMESIYKPKNGLGLKVSVSHSFKSFAEEDMVSGKPA